MLSKFYREACDPARQDKTSRICRIGLQLVLRQICNAYRGSGVCTWTK